MPTDFRSLVFLAAAAILAPARADACEPVACISPQFAPGAGGVVAADVPGIPLRLSTSQSVSPKPTATVEVVDANGKAQLVQVDTDPLGGWATVKPVKGLKPGMAYVLRTEDFCKAADLPSSPTPVIVQFPFTAGPPAPAPKTIGTLTVKPLPSEVIKVWTVSGSCTVGLMVGSVRLALQPSPELLPWLPVAQSEAWVDGLLWSTSWPGHVPFEGGPAQPEGWVGEASLVNRIYAPCGAVPNGVQPGLALGKHHLDFHIRLPGYSQPAYLSTDFDLSCQLPGADAGSSDAGSNVPPPSSPASNGCTAGCSGVAGWSMLLLGLVLALRFRRRPAAARCVCARVRPAN